MSNTFSTVPDVAAVDANLPPDLAATHAAGAAGIYSHPCERTRAAALDGVVDLSTFAFVSWT